MNCITEMDVPVGTKFWPQHKPKLNKLRNDPKSQNMTTKEKQTAGQLLVRSLVNQDVKFIFGIPGGKIMPTFNVLK
jgi:hypothetical protein